MQMTSEELQKVIPPQGALHRIHSQQRAKERYRSELTDADYRDMCRQCQEQRGVFWGRKEGSFQVKIWLVWWPSAQRIVPVYFRSGKVLSVLPTRATRPQPSPRNEQENRQDG